MKKTTIINEIHLKTNIPYKIIEDVINATLAIIADCLKDGEDVSLYGFGVFKIYKRSAKKVYIPGTKKVVHLESKKAIKFVPSNRLKRIVESIKD